MSAEAVENIEIKMNTGQIDSTSLRKENTSNPESRKITKIDWEKPITKEEFDVFHNRSKVNFFWYVLRIPLICILPLKLTIGIISWLCLELFMKVFVCGTCRDLSKGKISFWVRFWNAATCLTMRLWVFLMGIIWIEQKGKFHPKTKLLISNHISLLDPIIICGIQPWHTPSFVAKMGIKKVGLFKASGNAMRYVFVSRKEDAIRIKDEKNNLKADTSKECSSTENEKPRQNSGISKILAERMKDKDTPYPLYVFPEGTCTNGTSLLKFHTGAFLGCQKDTQIQLITFDYPFKYFDVADTWVSEVWLLFMHVFCYFQRVKVTYHQPFFPTDEDLEDVGKFTERMNHMTARACGIDKIYPFPLSVPWRIKRQYCNPNSVLSTQGPVEAPSVAIQVKPDSELVKKAN